jgi:hypothetical protein
LADQLTGGGFVFVPATDDSMAAAIERQLDALLTHPLPQDDTPEARDRRRLFAAIARGVIEHLIAHPGALEVVFTHVPAPHAISNFSAHVEIQASDV